MSEESRYSWDICQMALAARDGTAVMINVYMDESGTHDGSPVVAVGAFSARPKIWRKFTTSWNVAKHPIKVFHSTECEALRGEFSGWSAQERNTFVAQLLPVLPKFEIYGDAIGINIDDFNNAIKSRLFFKKLGITPYGVCFQAVVDNILWRMKESNNNEALAFIHEDNDYKAEAIAAFDYLKQRRQDFSSPMTLAFAPKELVPLQAADVLAYEANKRIRKQSRPLRRSLQAIDPDGTRTHIGGIDSSNINELLSRFENNLHQISLIGCLSHLGD